MKTFKGLYITSQGGVAVNEFPLEPKHNGYYPPHPLVWREYEEALAAAKQNATPVADKEQANDLLTEMEAGWFYYNDPEKMKDTIHRLPAGWDYKVEERCNNCDEPNCKSMLCYDGIGGHAGLRKVAILIPPSEKTDNNNMKTDNELIAEFMQVPKIVERGEVLWDTSRTGKSIYALKSQYLHYNDSWTWLMPVVEMIASLSPSFCDGKLIAIAKYEAATRLPISTPIEIVYLAVVEFIRWYNENVKQ